MKILFATLVIFLSFAGESALAARGNLCSQIFSERRIYTDASGERMAYEEHGPANADTIVLFFAGIDKDRGQWNVIRRRTQAEVGNVLYVQIDLLGQGETSKLNRGAAYSIKYKEQIRLTKALVEARGWNQKRLVVVGHSYGGGIAASYVRDVPGTVSDALLIDPFADNLEMHQPGVGPMMAMVKHTSAMMGLGGLYDYNVLLGSAIGMTMTWGPYSTMNGARNSLRNVLALTNGNRDLGMNDAMERAGNTRVHLMPSAFSEMVPASAHISLWSHVPTANRGDLVILPSSHDSVMYLPDLVANELVRVLKRAQ